MFVWQTAPSWRREVENGSKGVRSEGVRVTSVVDSDLKRKIISPPPKANPFCVSRMQRCAAPRQNYASRSQWKSLSHRRLLWWLTCGASSGCPCRILSDSRRSRVDPRRPRCPPRPATRETSAEETRRSSPQTERSEAPHFPPIRPTLTIHRPPLNNSQTSDAFPSLRESNRLGRGRYTGRWAGKEQPKEDLEG